MDNIWNIYKVSGKPKNNRENIITNNNYLKTNENSYENIRNHVLETQSSKLENVDQKIAMLSKKQINIKV